MATELMPNRAWARLASDEQITRTAAALETNGMRAIVVDTGDEARHQVFNLLPAGAQVMTMTSRTLETIGVAAEIDEPSEMAASRRYDAVRPRLMQMDMKTQWPEMRRMGASPDYTVGSVHGQPRIHAGSHHRDPSQAGAGLLRHLHPHGLSDGGR